MTGSLKALAVSIGVLLAMPAVPSSLDYDSVWQCNTRKTNWYCDESKRQPVPVQQPPVRQPTIVQPQQSVVTAVPNATVVNPTPQTVPAQQPKVTSLNEVQTIEQLRQLLKDKEDAAIMHPTEENMKEYLEVWKYSQEKASFFADQWQRTVWKNPHLDYSINHPTSAMGLNVANQQKLQTRNVTVQALAQKHGIIFFFRSDCPYCHATARVLKAMEQQYGVDIIAASLDGGALPEFPRPKDGRNLAQKWQVQVVPALFIANKQTAEYAPIGFGAMTMEEIVDRMYALTTPTGVNF